MGMRTAVEIIDYKLDELFDILDMEIYNGDLDESDVDKALERYGLTDVWMEWKDYG